MRRVPSSVAWARQQAHSGPRPRTSPGALCTRVSVLGTQPSRQMASPSSEPQLVPQAGTEQMSRTSQGMTTGAERGSKGKGRCSHDACPLHQNTHNPLIPLGCVIWGGPPLLDSPKSTRTCPLFTYPPLVSPASVPFPGSSLPSSHMSSHAPLLLAMQPSVQPWVQPSSYVLGSGPMCLCRTESCFPAKHPNPPWRTSHMLPDGTGQLSGDLSSRIHDSP